MIGRLRGLVLEKIPPFLLIEVAGVGYELEVSMSTFCHLTSGGESTLYTHLVVREDAQLLYGFASRSERELFRELIKISGVGPKLALSILSVLDTKALVSCVQEQDVAMLTRVPGVGKKTASRLLVEMQGRLDNWVNVSDEFSLSAVEGKTSLQQADSRQEIMDAINALISLGYKQNDASKAVNAIKNKRELASEQLIRQALQVMA